MKIKENVRSNDRRLASLPEGHDRNGRKHKTIKHSTGVYVDGDITTSGIESAFSLLKRHHWFVA